MVKEDAGEKGSLNSFIYLSKEDEGEELAILFKPMLKLHGPTQANNNLYKISFIHFI